MPAAQNAVLSSVASADIGKASGIFNMLRYFGGVFGVAILVAILGGPHVRGDALALRLATADAEERASTIAQGLGGHLGAVRNVSLGVYQITPRNSTDVSNEGISDTSSRLKDVTAVVSVTFAVNR